MQMSLPFFLDFPSAVFIAECEEVGVAIWQICYSWSTQNSQDNVCMEGTMRIKITLTYCCIHLYALYYDTHTFPGAVCKVLTA